MLAGPGMAITENVKKNVEFISNNSRYLIYQHIHNRTNAANFKVFLNKN